MVKNNSNTRRNVLYVSSFVAIGLIVVFWFYLVSGLPSLEQLENPKPELATKIYSVDGQILDYLFIKNRTQVSLSDVPPDLVNALLATEDIDFYNHWGVDLPRFMRAMVKNALSLRLREGASTITQQLSRNLYELKGSHESVFGKFTRKIREFITAVQIEKNYTKTEILEMYLSVSFFGRSAYGITSASQIYFGKSASKLTLAEDALLIGMLKGPGTYDPVRHHERALGRRNIVLNQMQKYGFITEAQAIKAKAEPIKLRTTEEMASAGIAPHFVEWIRQQLLVKAEKYGFDIYRDGLSVYTTLDSRMQRYANKAVDEHISEYQTNFDKAWKWSSHGPELTQSINLAIRTSDAYRDAEGAKKRDSIYHALSKNKRFIDSIKQVATRIECGFVAIDHRNGNIVAMVGGTNNKNFRYGLNHVTQIKRQPGSAFKPFVYTAAIDNGYPPCFELLNQPVTVVMADGKRWTPSNFDHSTGGKMTLREALKWSINLIAVRAVMEIAPIQQVISYAHKMGIKSTLPPYESIAIGTGEVQPLEITAAYGCFGNEGVYVDPISILRIEDKDGNVIEDNQPSKHEVLSAETAYLMTSMLKGNVDGGTGARVRNYFHLPAAGKTGTTQEYADAWFIGFTPHLTAGVWVGFDNKQVHFTTLDGQGGHAAAPIWGIFMQQVYDDASISLPISDFKQPEGVETDTICSESKKLATEFCPEREVEVFNKKFVPGKCDIHTTWRWKEDQERKSKISF
ncbi:MAG: penicillin-binding protein 1A [Bacteroidota bacterium]